MYPETDIPNIRVDKKRLQELRRHLPEAWESKVARLTTETHLSRGLALKIYDSDLADVLEDMSRRLRLEPSVIASMLVETPVRLAREGVPERVLSLPYLTELLKEIDSGRIAKEAGPDILRALGAKEGLTVSEAIDTLGLGAIGESEIGRVVDAIISRESNLIEEKGEKAFSPLMGESMKQLRGRADGATVGRIMKEKLLAAIHHKVDSS
jgi:glutamyl-tRNA(Gln) amidotransferase subunit E